MNVTCLNPIRNIVRRGALSNGLSLEMLMEVRLIIIMDERRRDICFAKEGIAA